MNKLNDSLNIANPAMSFAKTKDVDIDLFLRSVWWWFRLRVRGENLVLEIRDVPRSLGVEASFWIIQKILSLTPSLSIAPSDISCTRSRGYYAH